MRAPRPASGPFPGRPTTCLTANQSHNLPGTVAGPHLHHPCRSCPGSPVLTRGHSRKIPLDHTPVSHPLSLSFNTFSSLILSSERGFKKKQEKKKLCITDFVGYYLLIFKRFLIASNLHTSKLNIILRLENHLVSFIRNFVPFSTTAFFFFFHQVSNYTMNTK